MVVAARSLKPEYVAAAVHVHHKPVAVAMAAHIHIHILEDAAVAGLLVVGAAGYIPVGSASVCKV